MTRDKSKLHNCVSLIQSISIITVDGNSLSLEGVGYVLQSNLTVDNVLYVPQLSASLLSTGRHTDLGYHVNFTPESCVVKDLQTGIGQHIRRVGCMSWIIFIYQM